MILLIILIGTLIPAYLWFTWLTKNYSDSITIEIDNQRFLEINQYMIAVKDILEKQGKNVTYIGNRKFIVDGKTYFLHELQIPTGLIPMKQTILKRIEE